MLLNRRCAAISMALLACATLLIALPSFLMQTSSADATSLIDSIMEDMVAMRRDVDALTEKHVALLQENEGLVSRLQNLAQSQADLAQSQADLAFRCPPVGSVMGFMSGSWPPNKPGGGAYTEYELGWKLMDGRSFDKWDVQLFEEHKALLSATISKEAADTLAMPKDGYCKILREIWNVKNYKDEFAMPNMRAKFLRGIGEGEGRSARTGGTDQYFDLNITDTEPKFTGRDRVHTQWPTANVSVWWVVRFR